MSYQDPYNPGITRHAAAPAVQAVQPEQRKPVGSFSNPAGETQQFVGTGGITNSAAQRNRKRPKAGGLATSTSGIESPLNLDNLDSIVEESGLGKTADDDSPPGERMSDADPPSQGVHEDENGDLVHYRANPSGSVTRNPVGARSTTSYGASAPDYFSGG